MESLPWPPTVESIDALGDDDLRLLDSVIRSVIAKRRWAGTDDEEKRRRTEKARKKAKALPKYKKRAQTAAATAARQAKREAARRATHGGQDAIGSE